MSREEIIRRGYEAFEETKKLTPQERFRKLVERGIIDETGDVLMGPRIASGEEPNGKTMSNEEIK